jgi:sugar lactone lactonase YvrE
LKRFVWVVPLLGLLYLMAWPVDIEPVAWSPSPAPALDQGLYARNDALRGVQRIADGAVEGPEAIAFDAAGRLYTGLRDGRIVSMRDDGSDCRVIARTGGRPLGLQVQPDGALIVADAVKGLLRVEADGRITGLATSVEGIRLGFADDVAFDDRGRVLFTDASWKYGYGQERVDALEHGARGRLILHDLQQNISATLLAELQFANGVTLGPGGEFALVAQSSDYRITRYWLKGAKSGSAETFAENLPGFPDNLSFNGAERYWVALYSPRVAMFDALAPMPFLRTMVARLPASLLPHTPRQGFVLGLDLNGNVVEQYRYDGPGAFGPVTSVLERDGLLYLGSLSDTAIGRVSLADLRSGRPLEAPAPLKGSCPAA